MAFLDIENKNIDYTVALGRSEKSQRKKVIPHPKQFLPAADIQNPQFGNATYKHKFSKK